MATFEQKKKKTTTTNSSSSCSSDEQLSLSSLIKRVEKVQRAYVRRGGVFPVSFTGSIDDLRTIASRLNITSSTRSLAKERRSIVVLPRGQELPDGASIEMMCNDLSSFNDDQLNEWTKIFQEYWLTMLKTAKELLLWHTEPIVYRCSMKSDPCASKSFLSLGNLPFARLSLERILLVFEEDGAKPSESDDVDAKRAERERQQHIDATADRVVKHEDDSSTTEERLYISDSPVFQRLSFENKYLARRLVQRDLDL